MRYALVIEEATATPVKERREFVCRTDERAYTFAIDYILHDPANEPLRKIRLERLEATGWEFMGRWKRGPGWVDHPGTNGLIDRQHERR